MQIKLEHGHNDTRICCHHGGLDSTQKRRTYLYVHSGNLKVSDAMGILIYVAECGVCKKSLNAISDAHWSHVRTRSRLTGTSTDT